MIWRIGSLPAPVVALIATGYAVSVSSFQCLPSTVRPSASTRARVNTCNGLRAYKLPDENEYQLPDDDEKEEDTSVAEDTLASLVEKLDKSMASTNKEPDNKAMSFLKKIGRVGGAANKSFVNAVGSDEGSTGRQPAAARKIEGDATSAPSKKSRLAYQECTQSGIIDDLTEVFPVTSSGREWRGITDRVMGGVSNGILRREPDLKGRPANVLTGHVSLENNGGFLQMVTDLALDPSRNSVDASEYDGIEFEVLYRKVDENDDQPGSFNMHLRTPGTLQQASYRHTFQIEEENTWQTIRVPFSSFLAYGGSDDMPPTVNQSELRRIGLVAIGREVDIFFALSGIKFYSVI